MGKNPRFPVGFPPVVRECIKQHVGELGNSEAEVVKNIVLIYFTERGQFKSRKKKEGGQR